MTTVAALRTVAPTKNLEAPRKLFADDLNCFFTFNTQSVSASAQMPITIVSAKGLTSSTSTSVTLPPGTYFICYSITCSASTTGYSLFTPAFFPSTGSRVYAGASAGSRLHTCGGSTITRITNPTNVFVCSAVSASIAVQGSSTRRSWCQIIRIG